MPHGSREYPGMVARAVETKPGKRFTLYPHKLYLNSCATYHSAFVRDMLSNVKTGNTVLQGQCNAGVSTSAEKGFYGLGPSG